ncbi:hypothetical protein T484DRAFT_1782254, partial [Baffinella frigidus]
AAAYQLARAAVSLAEQFALREWGGLQFCFGIHSGDVVIGTVGKKCPRWEAVGDAMRSSLRMARAMQAPGVLVSEAAAALLQQHVASVSAVSAASVLVTEAALLQRHAAQPARAPSEPHVQPDAHKGGEAAAEEELAQPDNKRGGGDWEGGGLRLDRELYLEECRLDDLHWFSVHRGEAGSEGSVGRDADPLRAAWPHAAGVHREECTPPSREDCTAPVEASPSAGGVNSKDHTPTLDAVDVSNVPERGGASGGAAPA